jgi:hypothetical protein
MDARRTQVTSAIGRRTIATRTNQARIPELRSPSFEPLGDRERKAAEEGGEPAAIGGRVRVLGREGGEEREEAHEAGFP